MSFIAIDAKADVAGSKKGKLTPAQHAQLNAWCLAEKTGILDWGGRCEATYNEYTAQNYKATITFKRGYLVICGRLIQCENDTKFEFSTPTTGSEEGYIIAQFNLEATGEDEFIILQRNKKDGLTQDDLNNVVLGTYDFVLYEYKATPSKVTLFNRNISYIPDIGGKLSQFEKSLTDEGKPLGGYDTSKGTIEKRLTKLGFRSGSTILSGDTATVNTITRQGNYCILNLTVNDIKTAGSSYIEVAELPNDFMPNTLYSCYCFVSWKRPSNIGTERHPAIVTVNEAGSIELDLTPSNVVVSDLKTVNMELKCMGYIAKPIL